MATALEQALRRDRVVVAAALGIVAVAAWVYLIWLSFYMGSMTSGGSSVPSDGITGMNMGEAIAPGKYRVVVEVVRFHSRHGTVERRE